MTMNQAGTCSGDVASAQRWLENPPIVDDSSIRTVIHISIFFSIGGNVINPLVVVYLYTYVYIETERIIYV